MANSPVEVLLQPKDNELSIITTDDSTGESVETTLSPEQAWALVAELNAAILKLTKATVCKQPVTNTSTMHVHIDARGSSDPRQIEKAVKLAIDRAYPSICRPNRKPQVREAVLASLDQHQPRTSRHVPPGPPATKIQPAAFRTYEEQGTSS